MQPPNPGRLPVSFLLFTATTSGALVMVVEVLGSRVIGPFYGVSLFVWTSLITVALVALAAGYGLGGVLSDRWSGTRLGTDGLYLALAFAGVSALLIPAIKGPILAACQPLGLRAGALVSSTLLFGPTLLLLGCVSPWVVRLAARDVGNLGRLVGFFYALSTLGSFAGTVATGFVLIGIMGVSRIFTLVGGLLIGLAVVYFVGFRGRYVAVLALALPLIPLTADAPTSVVRASGTRAELVHSAETFYGSIGVIEYSLGVNHTRELAIDGLVQGGIDVKTGASVYAYSYLLGVLPRAAQPAGTDALVIGLGAGLVPNWLAANGVRSDVVDIDPEVARIAQEWFGYRPTGDIVLQDARAFLNRTDRSYDYIVLDVFNGDTTPGHLLSLEALQLVERRLRPQGVLAANLIGCPDDSERSMTSSVVRTLREVFDTVVLYPVFAADASPACGNLTLLAYDGAERVMTPRVGLVHPLARAGVMGALGRGVVPGEDPDAIVLTDDYNPIDLYELGLKEWVRGGIQAETDWQFLL